MQVTIFDGSSMSAGTPAQAVAAMNDANVPVTWVDMRLHHPGEDGGNTLISQFGIDPDLIHRMLTSDLELGFRLSPTEIHGVAWLDDNNGTPATQVVFHWTKTGLVTVRLGGDIAIQHVRDRLLERAETIRTRPSRLVGDVLQLMMATLQRGLTEMAVSVGNLDLEIIQTTKPNSNQSQELAQYRSRFQPLALRFPVYLVNIETALIDPPAVAGMDAQGLAALSHYADDTRSTRNIINSVSSGIRDAAQDLQAQVSTWQGNRINSLTVVTVVFLPASFLTGYFGMNFNWMVNHLGSLAMYLTFGVVLMVAVVTLSVVILVRGGYSLRDGVGKGRNRAKSHHKDAVKVPSGSLQAPK